MLEEALTVGLELDSVSLLAEALAAAAALRVDTDPVAATRLLGKSGGLSEERDQPVDHRYALGVFRATEERARRSLGGAFERERQAGTLLSLEGAVALALEES